MNVAEVSEWLKVHGYGQYAAAFSGYSLHICICFILSINRYVNDAFI